MCRIFRRVSEVAHYPRNKESLAWSQVNLFKVELLTHPGSNANRMEHRESAPQRTSLASGNDERGKKRDQDTYTGWLIEKQDGAGLGLREGIVERQV